MGNQDACSYPVGQLIGGRALRLGTSSWRSRGGKRMSVEANKVIVRRTFEEIFNQGNLALVETWVAATFVNHAGSCVATRSNKQVSREVK
jgi:hypothetical protein